MELTVSTDDVQKESLEKQKSPHLKIRDLTDKERTTLYDVVHADLILEEQVLRNANQLQVLVHNPYFFNSSHIVKAWLDATSRADREKYLPRKPPATNVTRKAAGGRSFRTWNAVAYPAQDHENTSAAPYKPEPGKEETHNIHTDIEHLEGQRSHTTLDNATLCGAQAKYVAPCPAPLHKSTLEACDTEHLHAKSSAKQENPAVRHNAQMSGQTIPTMQTLSDSYKTASAQLYPRPGSSTSTNSSTLQQTEAHHCVTAFERLTVASACSNQYEELVSPTNSERSNLQVSDSVNQSHEGGDDRTNESNYKPKRTRASSSNSASSGEVLHTQQHPSSEYTDGGIMWKLLPHPHHIKPQQEDELVIEMDALESPKHQGLIVRSFNNSLDSLSRSDSEVYAKDEGTRRSASAWDIQSRRERLRIPLFDAREESNSLRRASSWDFRTSTQSLPPLSQAELSQAEMEERRASASQTADTLVRKQSKYKLVRKQKQDQITVVSISRPSRAEYTISGEIYVRMKHKDDTLFVTIVEAKNLAAVDKKGHPNPYVKIYLLPDLKSSKRKTAVEKRTLDPLYNQTFKYSVTKDTLGTRALWVTVWSKNRWHGRGLFLGETCVSLASINLTNTTYKQWLRLWDYSDTSSDVHASLDSATSLNVEARSEQSSLSPSVTYEECTPENLI